MLTSEGRDDGMMVSCADTGRPICHVECAEITYRDDPKLKFPEKIRTLLPKDRWKVHFTGGKMTVAQVKTLAEWLGKD
jgi:hypothetical protein